jgi:hypothetical protein
MPRRTLFSESMTHNASHAGLCRLTRNSDEENNATSGGSVSANAHKANPVRTSLTDALWYTGWRLTGKQGPVHADNLPTPASKEELKKRAEELNK